MPAGEENPRRVLQECSWCGFLSISCARLLAVAAVAFSAVVIMNPPMATTVMHWEGAAVPAKKVPWPYIRLQDQLEIFHAGGHVLHTESWFFGNKSAPSAPYSFNEAGWLLRVDSVDQTTRIRRFGGRPLSGRWSEGGQVIIIADVLHGVLRYDPATDTVETIASFACDGSRIAYPDDIRVLRDGRVLISDASVHSPFVHQDRNGHGVTNQNVPVKLELLQGSSTGRFLVLDPISRSDGIAHVRYAACARVVSTGHRFANGIALAPADEDAVEGTPMSDWKWPSRDHGAKVPDGAIHALLVGSGDHEVSRLTLGPLSSPLSHSVWRGWASLDGIGDNIAPGPHGTWIAALPAERSLTFELLSRFTALRWLALRLPWVLWPPTPSFGAFVVLDGAGQVLTRYVDETGEAVSYINSVAAAECSRVSHQGFLADLCARPMKQWSIARQLNPATDDPDALPTALFLLGSLHGDGLPIVPLFEGKPQPAGSEPSKTEL